MTKLEPYKSYHFTGQDPVLRDVGQMINGYSYNEVAANSGVARGTLDGWFKGRKVKGKIVRTRRPQYATIMAVVHSLGYKAKFVKQR